MEAGKSDHSRKRTTRRRYTRKAPLTNCFMNMAEARREVLRDLQLHRSSQAGAARIINNNNNNNNNNHEYYNLRQLTASIPNRPEPTWSTTAPAVFRAPVPTVDVLEPEPEPVWFDNQSSSHTWWAGLLNSLDANINEAPGESSKGAGPCVDVDKFSSADATDQTMSDQTMSFLDFSAAEEEQK